MASDICKCISIIIECDAGRMGLAYVSQGVGLLIAYNVKLLTTSQEKQQRNIFWSQTIPTFNPLNAELNPICYLLALLGAHHFLHVSRIRVKLLTFRRLMSYIWSTHS